LEDKVYAILKLEVESSYQMVYLYFYCYAANSEEDIVKNFRDDLYSYFDRIPRGLSKISDFKEMVGSHNYDLNEETSDVELIDFKIYSDPSEFYMDMKECWTIEKNPEETKNERDLEDINFIYKDLTVNKDYHTARVIMVRDLDDNIFQYNMDLMTQYGVSYNPYKIHSK